jgi:hypothetical protein
MAVLFHTDAPRGLPMPLADMPVASSVATPTDVSLQHNANLMFDNVRPEVQTTAAVAHGTSSLGISLPFGERVMIHYGVKGEYRIGTLESADTEWVQVLLSDGNRSWIPRSEVKLIENAKASLAE